MATRYYNLENEAKAYLKACNDRGIVNQTSTKILNDYIIARKNNNLDASFLATNPIALNGLVLWLDASVGSSYSAGGNIWKDLSNSNINGTLVNNPLYSRANGGILTLNGSTQLIDITSPSLNIRNDVTYSVWIRSTSASGQRGILGDSVSFGNRWSLYIRNQNGLNYGWGVGGNVRLGNLSTNLWRNVVGTYSSTTSLVSLYDNSSFLGSASYTTVAPTYGNLNIGFTGSIAAPLYFAGDIANVQIYNRALTPQEILQNYNAQRSRFGL